ncbi:hypothetical protein NW756_008817 [Fusarium oxysporum]|nr:hypothetical protein NW753_013194 [Fusarium oxysporum]KAJ4038065.1 hypothetical protein NW763_013115 [Fusarium oxysporum]KAJ4085422.1 hypothetical protein NW756_008817 [Fusarium oxysporum]
MNSTTHPLLINIYDTLRQKFDAGDKPLFQMQVPTQPLQRSDFHYDGSDSNLAQMIKPSSVAEAEFRLTDGMLELSNIVDGPNGNKLSEKYDQVLSGLLLADEEVNPDQVNEALQQARENMRSCVTRNTDDTEDIYPVNLVPSDWAKSLSDPSQQDNTGGTHSDLQGAITRCSLLQARRDSLMAVDGLEPLRKAVENARTALSATEAEMVNGYTDSVVSCIKLYFAQTCSAMQDSVAAIKALNDKNKMELNASLQKYQEAPLNDDQWKCLVALQLKHVQNLNHLAKASDALSRAQMAASQATSSDGSIQLRIINDQIASLTTDIERYQKMVQEASSQNFEKIVSALPGNASTPGWETLTIDSQTSKPAESRLSCTSSSNLAWSANILSFSDSSRTSLSSSDRDNNLSTENTDVEVVFSATKVAIDRPWFNAKVLEKSSDLAGQNAGEISASNAEDVRNMFTSGSVIDITDCQLSSWTTSFLIVQNVYINLTSHTTFKRSQVHDIDSCLSSGGSLLCFRASKSDTNGDQGAGYSVQGDDKMIKVRISAPQVLGWFTQISL